MADFYGKLDEMLADFAGDIWVETVLEGPEAGAKYLLTAEKECGQRAPAKRAEKVFQERVGRMPRLVICGGGHVSIPVIQIGKMLGFTVTVLEDRPRFADNARQAGADQVYCEAFEDGLSKISGNGDTWFVIVTRGHRYDTLCLEAVLRKKRAYVGMMGSKRRTDIVKKQLEAKGYKRNVLQNVHTPIGLDIGAETPEEIAVSIFAEIIQIKNEKKSGMGYSKEILDSLLGRDRPGKEIPGEKGKEQKKVLATIISRKGSAPRSVGTKMLIYEEGSTVGTIGGGCAESKIIQKALCMMRAETAAFQICQVDMTAEEAEDEGMVCGGVIEVMLELVDVGIKK